MYKKALQKKLRFNTQKGQLNVEQLFTLSIPELKTEIKSAYDLIKSETPEALSFLEDDFIKKEDSENQLKYDILVDIYQTKVDIRNSAKEASAIKTHNDTIDALILKKQQEDLESKSIDELLKLKK